jgi:hypothetical protein
MLSSAVNSKEVMFEWFENTSTVDMLSEMADWLSGVNVEVLDISYFNNEPKKKITAIVTFRKAT